MIMMAIKRVDRRGAQGVSSKQCLSFAFAAIALVVACAPDTKAQTFFPPPVTLSSLTNGGTILVGDKLFSDFNISGYAASNITVEGIQQDGNFGIQFGGGFVANNSAMDILLSYQVTVTNPSNLISGANLSFNGVVVGGPGLAEVVEDVYTNTGDLYGQMVVFATQSAQSLSTNMVIAPPQPFLNVDKDVLVYAISLPAFSSISTINQTYTQVAVPEPSSLVLVAMATGLGVFLRGRRQTRR